MDEDDLLELELIYSHSDKVYLFSGIVYFFISRLIAFLINF